MGMTNVTHRAVVAEAAKARRQISANLRLVLNVVRSGLEARLEALIRHTGHRDL